MGITSEELKQLIEIKSKLAQLCRNWANKNLENGHYYCGFNLINNSAVCINYSYIKIINNVYIRPENECIRVTIDELNNVKE